MSVVQDLQVRYFAEAEDPTGVATSNLYINGALHEYYRKKTFQAYTSIPSQRRAGQRRPCRASSRCRIAQGLEITDVITAPWFDLTSSLGQEILCNRLDRCSTAGA
jgi:hypothetical protein